MNALELAAELEDEHYPWPRFPAAAELRRLHAEVERLTVNGIHTCHQECQRPMCRLTRQRDALLEALKAMLETGADYTATRDQARAAIAKAEENT